MFTFALVSALLLPGISSATIIVDGYTNTLSGFPGDSLSLYVNATAFSDAYKMSLYNLQGEVVASVVTTVFPQEAIPMRAYEVGFNYKLSTRFRVPNLKSGLYLWDNKIPFIIKARNPSIVVLYASNTENAYSNTGGKSLYAFNSSNNEAAVAVSFNRPLAIERFGEAFFRWMEKQDLPGVGYISDADMDHYKEISKAHFLIVTGHSEYWTLKARKNFDRFIAEGKDAMVLSGNTMWWQVRYSRRQDQLLCYRKADLDKTKSTKLKTILWNDSTLGYPILKSIGADFSYGGYGDKKGTGFGGYKIINESPLLEGTGLKKGEVLKLISRETDGAPLAKMERGVPELDNSVLGFHRVEIVGFDHVLKGGTVDAVATWIIFKRSYHSGTVVNVASTNWCSANGIGSNPQIQRITQNMITKLSRKENIFTAGEIRILNPEPGLVMFE
jgi:hypothetical protein